MNSSSNDETNKATITPRRRQACAPPPGSSPDYYSNNPTIFGKILRGEIPAAVVEETSNLLAFQDIRPAAPMHTLIIPKQWIPSVFDLTSNELMLLQEMQQLAQRQLQQQQPQAFAADGYRLIFLVPPFNMVAHTHLHVIAPASSMSAFHRLLVYRGGYRWCIQLATVIARLQAGQKAVPWSRSILSWWSKTK